ncbi:MAG: hypothetical protein DI535_10545 [Citrobacter freundii]|nr:MAG: hypothetical protein DI535_10545 [Citrobacter freundii]
MDIETDNYPFQDPEYLRIQTKRTRIRKIKGAGEKYLIGLGKKRRHLWELQRKLGYVPLDIPYQSGWKRKFELRDDVAKSKRADFFQEILDLINIVEKSPRKDFKKKTRRFGKRIYKPREQYLKKLEPEVWIKLSDKKKDLFYPGWFTDLSGKLVLLYVFAEPWRFVLRVRPNMITHTKKLDSELESESDRLEQYIERNFLGPAMDRSRGKRYYRWKMASVEQRCHYKKTTAQYLEDLKTETGPFLEQN